MPRSGMTWFPMIDLSQCNGYGIHHYKHDVFAVVNGGPLVVKPENYVIRCKAYGWVCPIGVITYSSKDELREMLKKARKIWVYSDLTGRTTTMKRP